MKQYVSSLALNENYIYVGLLGGIWRKPISELVDVNEAKDGTPHNFSLKQNYPNPFNPSTTIPYEIPLQPSEGKTGTAATFGRSLVSLRVFDVIGREVAVLVNEQQSAGSYSIQWNASNVPSGMYFYRLQSGSYAVTKKIVLLK
jgi:hypothetical protein